MNKLLKFFVHATKNNILTMSFECNMETTYILVKSTYNNPNFGNN